MDCVVIGAGLSGLRCAHELVGAGLSVTVLEADDAVGGRARTLWHRDLPVDRGFQTIFAAYEQTRSFCAAIGIPERDLRRFAREAVIWTGEGWVRLRPDPRLIGRLPGVSPADLAKLVAELAYYRVRPRELPLTHGTQTTIDYLRETRGYSEAMIDLVFRPLLAGITLDRDLGSDCGYAMYLMGLLARGPAMIPADGVGMIAEWAASAIRQRGGTIALEAAVARITLTSDGRTIRGVALADGREIAAKVVVLAVDAPAAAGLLVDVDPAVVSGLPTESASVTNAAFHLDAPLYEGRTLLLNGAADIGVRPRVDLVCQTSNLTRPQSPDGHIVLAQSVTTGEEEPDADAMIAAVEAALRRSIPGFDWARHASPIDVWHHGRAQFRVMPGVREAARGVVTRLSNLVLAGDMMRHPSIEGAVGSGAAAATVARNLVDVTP